MDLNDIINTLIAEANAEGPEGMRRVAETILNRAAIRGISPDEVVRQPAQYTGFFSPGPAAVAAQQNPQVRAAAQAAWNLAMQPGDPTNGADHYYNPNIVNPGWQNSMQHTGDHGGHTFYRSRQVPAAALAALLQRTAPIPQMPPARGNVPSSLIADSFGSLSKGRQSNGLSPSTVKSVVDMFAEPVRDVTPRMGANGSVTSPADIVFGKQMTTSLGGSQKSASDLARGKSGISTIASIPTVSKFSASDLARGKSGISTIASIPTTGVGAPPSTRSVASVPFGPQSQPASKMDPTGAPSSWADFATTFGKKVPGPAGTTNNNKTADRLPASSDLFPAGSPVMQGQPTSPTPRPAADATKARTRTVTEQVLNPAWTAAQSVPAGMKVNFGSRDSVAQRAAGAITAQNIPKYLTRTRQVPVAAPAKPVVRAAPPALQPRAATRPPLEITVNGSNTIQPQPVSVVARLRAMGMSPSQAYAAANSGNNGPASLDDRITGRANNSGGGASSLSSM